ncbi:peptidoglycan editing factor PgeF [Porticoccus sp.]|uniref:peptidoglycan editing factor PgeF n=1 Tax=Porticoccus sp. TaxID=2024853 RepID=UPI000C3C3F6E|nr:peptidoglycan editing factor PgeF [Porticoccus sp.]MAZ69670.1 hypothetical protein [Porticoccus sp.]|tara:strand:+ start:2051 stop:2797 length:747 start_codon:yes stop_codon:yes gene_type:complete
MSIILPDWPAPHSVKAAVSTRRGGLSAAAWRSLNLAYHVGDNAQSVEQNWQLLGSLLRLPVAPQLLEQVHGTDVVHAQSDGIIRRADACYSDQQAVVCTVMTADCLPILICDRAGGEVAAVHAGWRGLAGGVVANAISQFKNRPDQLLAWLGPAISQPHFEVGEDVYRAFLANTPGWGPRQQLDACFLRTRTDRWQADIFSLARLALSASGITAIFGGGHCTFANPELFYSYRRDGQTGRMASLIWIS